MGGMMMKNRTLQCPNCNAIDAKLTPIDNRVIKETRNASIIETERAYRCTCRKCKKIYELYYGKSVLKRYNKDSEENVFGDIKIYVTYDSEYDTSYKIIKTNDVMMMITNNDEYPIVINDREIIDNPAKVRSMMYKTRRNRYK